MHMWKLENKRGHLPGSFFSETLLGLQKMKEAESGHAADSAHLQPRKIVPKAMKANG